MSNYVVTYVSGIARQPVPMPKQILKVTQDGISILKYSIEWQYITEILVENGAETNRFSVGKAIAGDMLVGSVGAMIGGLSGKTEVRTLVRILHTIGDQTSELVVEPKGNPKLKTDLINKLVDNAGKLPVKKIKTPRKSLNPITTYNKQAEKYPVIEFATLPGIAHFAYKKFKNKKSTTDLDKK